MAGRYPHYLSYLLRLWQGGDQEEQAWRASLESVGTGERRAFTSLDDLFNFLRAQTGSGDVQERKIKDAR